MNIDEDKLTEDPVSLVTEIARDALWDIHYHENEMKKANRNLSNAKTYMRRLGLDDRIPDGVEADSVFEDEFETTERFAQAILAHYIDGLKYHERGLAGAHLLLAHVKIMLARGRYTEIDLIEIQKEIEKKYNKNME